MLVAQDQHPPERSEDHIPSCLQRYELDACVLSRASSQRGC